MLGLLAAATLIPSAALAIRNPYAASFPQCKATEWLPLSCTNNKTAPAIKDELKCCSINPGGLVLQTQIWSPISGLDKQFTVHGLWPDYCDGTYPAYCLPDGANATLPNLEQIFQDNNALDLFYEMQQFWVSDTTSDASFYAHETLKHGSCISTFNKECYGDNYIEGQEHIEYFRAALKQYHLLPTYRWLENAGITPSANRTYLYNDFQTALRTGFGQNATITCDKNGNLAEVWYNFNVYGTAQDGAYIPVPPPSNFTSCPLNATGIRYPPKVPGYKHSPYGFGADNMTYFL